MKKFKTLVSLALTIAMLFTAVAEALGGGYGELSDRAQVD